MRSWVEKKGVGKPVYGTVKRPITFYESHAQNSRHYSTNLHFLHSHWNKESSLEKKNLWWELRQIVRCWCFKLQSFSSAFWLWEASSVAASFLPTHSEVQFSRQHPPPWAHSFESAFVYVMFKYEWQAWITQLWDWKTKTDTLNIWP